jgi:selenide,water dikinase
MRKYRDLPAMNSAGKEMEFTARAKSNLRIEDEETEREKRRMRCGGCGAKVSALILHQVLARVDAGFHSSVQIGLSAPDDAAVLAPPPGRLLVQSVDFFRAFINDPYLLGRIATNHALNDLFAMGATPANALVTATIPFNGANIIADQLGQLLGGVAFQLRLHQSALAGGHTAEGRELGVGLTVNGFADPRRLFRNTGLQAGDRLILTKPLGTGTILAANMEDKVDPNDLETTIAMMLKSNRAAMDVLIEHGVGTCTDVSGFGLIGHLREMFGSDERLVNLDVHALPLLPGALEAARDGVRSSLSKANAMNRSLMNWQDADTAMESLLFDPQTSGGLLAAVPAEAEAAVLDDLIAAGYGQARSIGQVAEGRSTAPILVGST